MIQLQNIYLFMPIDGEGSGLGAFLPLILLIVIIYFVIRVSNKRKKPVLGKPTSSKPAKPEGRYPALMTISKIYAVFAWIAGIASVITALYLSFLEVSYLAGFSLLVIGIGIIVVLSFKAISELIKVLIDIEYNTRSKKDNDEA